MKKIRIGNDIHIRWRIMRSGDDEDFTGKDVQVTLHDSFGRTAETEWDIDGSVIALTFRGRSQVSTGAYTLTLTENRGRDGMLTVDRIDAFRLIPRQNSVVQDGDEGCRCGCGSLTVETVNLTSELQVPSLGKGVVRVYNIARGAWGNGLVSDGESVNVRIADDSGDVLSVDAAGLHIDKKALGTGAQGSGEPLTTEEIDKIIKEDITTETK